MGPWILFLTGAAAALYSLVQLRRWLAAAEEAREVKAAVPESAARPQVRRGGSRRRLQAVEQEAYTLVDAGFSVGEVARRLGLTKAEVQLILGLRRSR